MNRTLIWFALACAAGSVLAAEKQQVYKWTDANGVVHFTDAPPPKETPNVQAVRMLGSTTAPAETEDKPKETTEADTAAKAAADRIAAVNAPPDQAALCKTARGNLEMLQSKKPVAIAGADGKPEVLDDKGREAQLNNAQLTIQRYCQ